MPASVKARLANRWWSVSMSTVVRTPSGRIPRIIHTPEIPQPVPISTTFLALSRAATNRRAAPPPAPIGSGAGATLRFLASVIEAGAVVEVGTGTGVSGLWLLRGMRSDGVLTTVDIETEHQRLARETFNEAGIPTQRARTIAGAALDVLPRLTDGHYDIVFVDGDKAEYAACLSESLRLLRPGGVVAFDNALWHDRVADPSVRDDDTQAIRELIRQVGADDGLVPVLLPVGDGLLLAKKEWTPEAG